MYEIVLEAFTGPLDLLLHLIRKQELNIHDIPMSVVTDQYLRYLRAMDELSLDVASEFVVMAAWLLAIKSRMLLPRPTEELTTEENLDPREELVAQLMEYERCKLAATGLEQRQVSATFMASREPMDLSPFFQTERSPLVGVTMWDLVDAFRKVLDRTPKETVVAEIKGKVHSVKDIMSLLLERLTVHRVMLFRQYLSPYYSRQELVSAFLALLELIKDNRVYVRQTFAFDDIQIGLVGDDVA